MSVGGKTLHAVNLASGNAVVMATAKRVIQAVPEAPRSARKL